MLVWANRLAGGAGGCVVAGLPSTFDRPRGIPPQFVEIEMSDQTKDCEECYGTGNEARMRGVEPGRKIVFHPCPACGGTGKVPEKAASA